MKIPETSNPFKVIVNGVEKTYEAGATVSDDASVKEIIDNGDLFPPEALPVETPFPIPTPEPGTTVVANPTLAGDEDSLTGLQVGDTKYSVGGSSSGGALVVNIAYNAELGVPVTDKTAGEVLSAIGSGIVPMFRLERNGGFYIFDLLFYSDEDGEDKIINLYNMDMESFNGVYTATSDSDYFAYDVG